MSATRSRRWWWARCSHLVVAQVVLINVLPGIVMALFILVM